MKFEGAYTAIITPFREDGERSEINWDALARLIQFQNENGIIGIVPQGTTGESPTTSHDEHNRIVQTTIENSKCQVIAGTGSNCTWEAIEMSKYAQDVGAHATLQVCPYYNKPNQEGLFRHFSAVAEAVDLPHILYNIPGRSGRAIEPETMARLAKEHSNIVGVKEASGDPKVWKRIREVCERDFVILSGDDGRTYELMKEYGARGVISVASNIAPRRIVDYAQLGLDGKWQEMEKESEELTELMEVLFIDTNPIPVKEAAAIMGLCELGFRLPMCQTSEKNRERIRSTLQKYKLI